ncbi:NlpC/P60 family protein [Oceaniglobus ichthyenteri]|uniref:C40 family peptidase n=1 Tax=Oceaniglobus ichthyenteri TaxID=2136177 RepID=UPI000D3C35BF|nr:NlpC/P60 family protein [Oceaniglobus ichthyenteri]
MTDRRQTPANGRVAAAHLEGEVKADRFVTPQPAQVITFAVFLLARPDGPRDRQLLFGDIVDVYERRGGVAFVQSRKDGYCGYLDEAALGPVIPPTHAVRVRQTHIYPQAGMKAAPLMRLPFNARVSVSDDRSDWHAVNWHGGTGIVHRDHLRPVSAPLPDPAETAALFLGTPYLWAGNTGDGLDCSGLVQAACLAAGIACMGDSDQQARTLGVPLGDNQPCQRNDVIFWAGHVALAEDADTMIHATAFGMITRREPIADAIARIEAGGDGPVTMRRRLFP